MILTGSNPSRTHPHRVEMDNRLLLKPMACDQQPALAEVLIVDKTHVLGPEAITLPPPITLHMITHHPAINHITLSLALTRLGGEVPHRADA